MTHWNTADDDDDDDDDNGQGRRGGRDEHRNTRYDDRNVGRSRSRSPPHRSRGISPRPRDRSRRDTRPVEEDVSLFILFLQT